MLALQLFWRKGYAATSIEDLVEALHLSRSSLYDTFGDKRTLFIASLKLYSERVVGRITQTLNGAPTPLAGIEAVFADLLAGVGEEPGRMGCFMVNSVAELVPYDRDVSEIATAYNTAIQRLLSGALAQGIKQGSLPRRLSPDPLATYLFNAFQGLRILIKSGATRKQAQAVVDLTLASLR